MEYLTSKQLSEKWGIGPCRINQLAREGRIDGAKQFGKSWMFPSDAVKPMDGRTATAKAEHPRDDFRFPLFVNLAPEGYHPPLSDEEQVLREAELAFYACEFESAREKIEPLCMKAGSIHVKIACLFLMCVLSAAYDREINWIYYRRHFMTALMGQYAHKPEMELLNPWLDCVIGKLRHASKDFSYETGYGYHPSAHALQAYLSIYRFVPGHVADGGPEHLDTYEIIANNMDGSGRFAEAQCLHRILFVSYLIAERTDCAVYHLKKMLTIAYEHDLIFPAADYEPYYSDLYAAVLADYPKEFAEKLHRYGKQIYKNFNEFTSKYLNTKFGEELTQQEYRLIIYASRKYSNKQLAATVGLSERTVANLLAGIYEKLGVKNKQELTELANNAI